MEQQIKKGDYLLLLPSAIPITILFILPLLYSLSLIFTTPVYDELGKEIYSDSNYEYHYSGEINRYRQYHPETNEYTGDELRPYEIKSDPEIYKQVKTWGVQNIKIFFLTNEVNGFSFVTRLVPEGIPFSSISNPNSGLALRPAKIAARAFIRRSI